MLINASPRERPFHSRLGSNANPVTFLRHENET